MDKIHEYFFNRKYVEWGILDFLTECEEHYFKKKIDLYIKTLLNLICERQSEKKHVHYLIVLRRQVKKLLVENMVGISSVVGNLLVSSPFKTFCRATKSVLRHGRTSRFYCLMFKTSCRLSIDPVGALANFSFLLSDVQDF
ncbi:13714_t:CDS:1, partial [Ambispora leptoticha]